MRFEEVYDRWSEHRLTQQEAADLVGVSERQFRRQCRRYESDGLDGLIDLRLGQVSTRRAPVDEVLRLVNQYRERYVGWTVKHFYSKYREQKGRVATTSCAWRCSAKGWWPRRSGAARTGASASASRSSA